MSAINFNFLTVQNFIVNQIKIFFCESPVFAHILVVFVTSLANNKLVSLNVCQKAPLGRKFESTHFSLE